MAAFAVEDSLLKTASTALPVGEVLILFGFGGTIFFASAARASGQPLFGSDVLSRTMLIRAFFEVFGRLFYVLAISLASLSAATVILQATPLVVVASTAIFFGERVGWRRWLAIFIGLAGVVIIVQPGTEGFSALSVLAIIGMIGFAGRDLASRVAPASLGTWVLGFYGFLAVVLTGAAFALWQGAPFMWPTAQIWLVMLGAVLAGVTGYSCLMKAMRTGEVSAVTPFRYSRLLFGVGLGVMFFDEEITGAMVIGSALILLSGLFILWRGRQVGG